MKLVLDEYKQQLEDPLSLPSAPNNDSSVESDDGSVSKKAKPSRKRQSPRITNHKEQVTRDESPDTKERNELAKILLKPNNKMFKRNLDELYYDSGECKCNTKVFVLLLCLSWISFIISAGGLYQICPPLQYISVLRRDEGLADLYEDHL